MDSDRNRIKQLRRGDQAALEAIIKRWYQPILRYASRRLLDDALGAEIAQETFARLLENLPEYRGKQQLGSYLFTIARNLINDAFRRPPPDMPGEETFAALPGAQSPAISIERAESAETVRRLLRLLPDSQREAIVLRYYENKKLLEIARLTGANLSTVKSRIRQGLRRMQKALQEEGYS